MTGIVCIKLVLSMQYEVRIFGAGTCDHGGTWGEPYDTAGGAETRGIMRGYCCAATLPSRQNYTTFQHSRQRRQRDICVGDHPPFSTVACASDWAK